MADQLSAKDWLDQGLKTLAESGYTALKAEPLAKAMGVSRGSFYWHFADVEAVPRGGSSMLLARGRRRADHRQRRGRRRQRQPAAVFAAPGVRRAAGAGERGPRLGHGRPGGQSRGAGHRPAPADLRRKPVQGLRAFTRRGSRAGANSLLGVSRLCAVGQTLAAGATAGGAGGNAPDGLAIEQPGLQSRCEAPSSRLLFTW